MLIDISPKGELLSDATRRREILSWHQPKWRGRRKVLSIEFAKYTERKEGDYSERRTREGRCGITFWERSFSYTTDRFRKKFDLYDLYFGEHRFAICEDVCVSHLHSIFHCSRTNIADTFRWCCWLLNVQTDAFTEFSEWSILTSSASPRL